MLTKRDIVVFRSEGVSATVPKHEAVQKESIALDTHFGPNRTA